MVVALAGRRIDENDSLEKRFPLSAVDAVETRLFTFFSRHAVTKLICSGANGADLIALKVAKALDIDREMILPFDAETFKKISVTDRPGNWLRLFNEYYEELSTDHGVKILQFNATDNHAFDKTSLAILDYAESVVEEGTVDKTGLHAVVVWDKVKKKVGDASYIFFREAIRRSIPVTEILSL